MRKKIPDDMSPYRLTIPSCITDMTWYLGISWAAGKGQLYTNGLGSSLTDVLSLLTSIV